MERNARVCVHKYVGSDLHSLHQGTWSPLINSIYIVANKRQTPIRSRRSTRSLDALIRHNRSNRAIMFWMFLCCLLPVDVYPLPGILFSSKSPLWRLVINVSARLNRVLVALMKYQLHLNVNGHGFYKLAKGQLNINPLYIVEHVLHNVFQKCAIR